MNRITQKAKTVLKFFNIHKLKNFIFFVHDFVTFKKKHKQNKNLLPLIWKNRYPCLQDKTTKTYFDRHYIYHTSWAARILEKTKPALHTDISSSLYFVSIASAFVPIKFYDYRPAKLHLSNLFSENADLLALPFKNQSIQSLSCMHVVEHVGLGRYGDPLDPEGDLKAINELQRVLAPNGNLLFVVPVGKPQIMFNAHRIYSPEQIKSMFSDLTLKSFALVPDNPNDGELIENPSSTLLEKQTYGCGCFWFTR